MAAQSFFDRVHDFFGVRFFSRSYDQRIKKKKILGKEKTQPKHTHIMATRKLSQGLQHYQKALARAKNAGKTQFTHKGKTYKKVQTKRGMRFKRQGGKPAKKKRTKSKRKRSSRAKGFIGDMRKNKRDDYMGLAEFGLGGGRRRR